MKLFLLAAALVAPAWNAASAQDSSDLRIRVGLGAQLEPQFLGSDKRRLEPLFRINTARDGNEFNFSAPDDAPSIAVVTTDGFSFGPAGNIQGRRRESDVGAPVGSVARTLEVGAFAQYEAHDSFRVRGEILKAVNGNNGVLGSIGVDKIWRNGDRYVFSVGPRLLLSDARFERAYFGVTPRASLASGLPVYQPGGGIYGVALASGASYQLSGPWGLFGYARYERLVGDAAKSPIIREFGSRNQMSGGIGLSYTFTIHR